MAEPASSQHRTRLVGIVSTKGGVGKTTLTLNLGWALAARGWRVLVVDTDPQGGIALSVAGDLDRQPGLFDLWFDDVDPSTVRVPTRCRDFSLLPLGSRRDGRETRWMAEADDPQRMRRLLSTAGSGFDLVLVDTAPGLYGATRGVLRAVDGLLAPLMAEPLAARSLRGLLEAVGDLRQQAERPELLGIVLTLLQSRQADSLEVARESWRLFPGRHVLDTSIPRDEVFLQASAAGVPVALLRRRPPAVAAIFDALAAELEPRFGLERETHGQAISLLG